MTTATKDPEVFNWGDIKLRLGFRTDHTGETAPYYYARLRSPSETEPDQGVELYASLDPSHPDWLASVRTPGAEYIANRGATKLKDALDALACAVHVDQARAERKAHVLAMVSALLDTRGAPDEEEKENRK